MLATVVKLTACALLGTLTTVAVAWSIALRGTAPGQPHQTIAAAWANSGPESTEAEVTVYREIQVARAIRLIRTMRGPGRVLPDTIETQLGGGLRIAQDPPYPRIPGPPRPCHLPPPAANCASEYQMAGPSPASGRPATPGRAAA